MRVFARSLLGAVIHFWFNVWNNTRRQFDSAEIERRQFYAKHLIPAAYRREARAA
jgi:hypothetical protein